MPTPTTSDLPTATPGASPDHAAAPWTVATLAAYVPRIMAMVRDLSRMHIETCDAACGAVNRDQWSWWMEGTGRIRAELLRLVAGPEAVAAEGAAALDGLREHAPDTYQAIAALAVRLTEGLNDLGYYNAYGDRVADTRAHDVEAHDALDAAARGIQ